MEVSRSRTLLVGKVAEAAVVVVLVEAKAVNDEESMEE